MSEPAISRRAFIRLGLAGSAVVASGATLATVGGCSPRTSPAEGFAHLREGDLELLRPMVPVLLEGAIADDGEGTDQALAELDALMAHAAPGALLEIYRLLDTLRFPPMRYLLTGTWRHFAELEREQLVTTLATWSGRNLGLARLALRAIAQPMLMAWYMRPEAGAATGYPGPPRVVIS